jgi:hypothetical protein
VFCLINDENVSVCSAFPVSDPHRHVEWSDTDKWQGEFSSCWIGLRADYFSSEILIRKVQGNNNLGAL